ncbi:thymidylate kinase [Novosphingobium chloroacetimidivorans]|uniref:Thymidylate kinase n=2 Tax=Novosphingobium chloroacetimidivorans TaxID=1428314 RepID=A0A7W7K6J0_9SPHN|nr:thymidylate kinase [Novosphingobium chloroacetimidivorans]
MRDAILSDLAAGRFVLCDRYVSSNIAFQSAKLDDPTRKTELDRLLRWLEYETFGLPHPDLEIAMVARDSYFETGRHLLRSIDPSRAYAEGHADIHERETGLQLAVNAYYHGLANARSVRLLEIDPDEVRLDIDKVSDLIWAMLVASGMDVAEQSAATENSHVD